MQMLADMVEKVNNFDSTDKRCFMFGSGTIELVNGENVLHLR